ncbi:carbohydrate-binding protein [Nonomuraea thailandensis]
MGPQRQPQPAALVRGRAAVPRRQPVAVRRHDLEQHDRARRLLPAAQRGHGRRLPERPGRPDADRGHRSRTADDGRLRGRLAEWHRHHAAPTDPPGGVDARSTIQAERYQGQSGTIVETTTDSGGGQNVGAITNGDWLRYDGVDFGSTPATQFRARVASGAAAGVSGLVQVRLDSPTAPPIGDFALASTGGWQSWRTIPANVSGVTGTHTVYLTFSSGQPADFVNVNWFTFSTS